MKRYLLLAALLLMPMLALGQGNTTTLVGSGAPAGGCAFVMRYIDSPGQMEYGCTSTGTWFQVGPTAAGAVSLSSTTDLTGAKTFSNGASTLTFNISANSGSGNMFNITDLSTNTGTGYLLSVLSGSSSAIKPARICYRGTTDCPLVINTTTLTTSGAAVIDATKLFGALPALDGSALTNVNAITLLTKTWASPSAIGTGTPAAGTFTTLTANTSLVTSLWTAAEAAISNGSGTTTWNIGVDSTTHLLTCLNSLGTSCLGAGGVADLTNAFYHNQGTTTTLLHGNASGNLSWAAVSLANDVTGNLGVSHLNSGTSADNTHFWRGDGTWAVPAGGGSGCTIGGTVGQFVYNSGSASCLSDTATTDGSGGWTATSLSLSGSVSTGVGGSVAGGYEMTQGTANSIGSNAFLIQAPASISTSFGWTFPAAENGSAGLVHVGAASSHLSALTVSAVVDADISGTIGNTHGGTGQNSSAFTGVAQVSSGTWSASTALANGTTGTTQADSSNDTKVATDAYVDAQNIIVTSGLTAGHGYYVSAANTLTEAGGGISATTPAICVATSSTVCRVRGIYTTSGLTAGAVYYVPTTAAVLTTTAPSSTGQFVQRVGVALSTTVLLINPSIDVGTIQ